MKEKAVPTVTVSEAALVMVGAWLTVSVKAWVTVPDALVAVRLTGNTPVAVAVPAMVAVPLAAAVKVTPAGSVPASVRVGDGAPVVFTEKVKALPRVAVSVA